MKMQSRMSEKPSMSPGTTPAINRLVIEMTPPE